MKSHTITELNNAGRRLEEVLPKIFKEYYSDRNLKLLKIWNNDYKNSILICEDDKEVFEITEDMIHDAFFCKVGETEPLKEIVTAIRYMLA